MRGDQKWFLRGRRLLPRTGSIWLIPNGDFANAPPFLPIKENLPPADAWPWDNADDVDHTVISVGSLQSNEPARQSEDAWDHFTEPEGDDGIFVIVDDDDDPVGPNATTATDQPTEDTWDWHTSDDEDRWWWPENDAQQAGELAADVLWVDPDVDDDWWTDELQTAGDLTIAPEDAWDHFTEPEGDDGIFVIVDDDDDPVVANAVAVDQPTEDAWDHFTEPEGDDGIFVIIDDDDEPVFANAAIDQPPEDAWPWTEQEPEDDWQPDQAQDPSETTQQTDWDWEEALDDWQPEDQPQVSLAHQPFQDEWFWHEEDSGEEFGVEDPGQVTLEALAYQTDPSEDETADDWWQDEPPQTADGPPEDVWPHWQDEVPEEDCAPQDSPQDADRPPEDAPTFDEGAEGEFWLDELLTAVAVDTTPADDVWEWTEAVGLDVVPTTYAQSDFTSIERQETDDVIWDWSEDGGALATVPVGYFQSNAPFLGSPESPPEDWWHWDYDDTGDDWFEGRETLSLNGPLGVDINVVGDQATQALLRRRDDFETAPTRDEDWVFDPTSVDDTFWIEGQFSSAEFFAQATLAYQHDWEWAGNEGFDDWEPTLETQPIASPPTGQNLDVLGEQAAQALLRRRDDFESDPTRDEDWDWGSAHAQESEPIPDSSPVVDTQVLFLQYPVDDAWEWSDDPDATWREESQPVVADAAPALPRTPEDHWWHWEDGLDDDPIHESTPVDGPPLAAPDEWNWNEEATEDNWWIEAPYLQTNFFTTPGPEAYEQAWEWDRESTDGDAWWSTLPTPDTDGTTGPDLCPIALAAALARIAELEALLAECRLHQGNGDGGGGGDDDHHHHDHYEEDIHRRKRERIEANNRLIMALVGSVVHGIKGPKK